LLSERLIGIHKFVKLSSEFLILHGNNLYVIFKALNAVL
jgi:hypothetical protein